MPRTSLVFVTCRRRITRNARQGFLRGCFGGVTGRFPRQRICFAARMLLAPGFLLPWPKRVCEKKAAETRNPKLPRVHMLLGELYLYKSRIPEAVEPVSERVGN